MTELEGVVPYMFIGDDTIVDGLTRLDQAYPRVQFSLDATSIMGSLLKIRGQWEDVFAFFIGEYVGADADTVLQAVAGLKEVAE